MKKLKLRMEIQKTTKVDNCHSAVKATGVIGFRMLKLLSRSYSQLETLHVRYK